MNKSRKDTSKNFCVSLQTENDKQKESVMNSETIDTKENKKTAKTTKKSKGRKKKIVGVPYMPGFYCKYLVPDPFGTGR